LAGHLKRMGNNEIHRSIMNFRLEGRTMGRPKLHWTEGVLEDLKKF
jgi:hypothetical protein